jgi:putative Mg2+ transporter-C (MgtC) family protein
VPGEGELILRLALTFVLSAGVGLERELRQKSAGLRTHTLVGVGAALFTLAGGYGFHDGLAPGHVVLDPSRVAAQVASGIGFIGGGLIFVRRDAVRGLTTAAGIWVTAAIGLAAGSGLLALAGAATGAYFLVAFGFPPVAARLPRPSTARAVVQVTYLDGRGVLREAIAVCVAAGFAVADISTRRLAAADGEEPPAVSVRLELQGTGRSDELLAELGKIGGVLAVNVDRPDDAE